MTMRGYEVMSDEFTPFRFEAVMYVPDYDGGMVDGGIEFNADSVEQVDNFTIEVRRGSDVFRMRFAYRVEVFAIGEAQ